MLFILVSFNMGIVRSTWYNNLDYQTKEKIDNPFNHCIALTNLDLVYAMLFNFTAKKL